MLSVLLLALGVGLVIAGAEILLDGLLASASRPGVSAFDLDAATRHLHLPAALAATLVLCATLWLCGGITRLIGAAFLTL